MSGASARYSGLRIPVETSTPPRQNKLRSAAFPGKAGEHPFRSVCSSSQNRTRFAGLRFCWCGLRARGAALPCDLCVCLGQGLLRCLAGPFKTGPGLLGSGFVGVGCAQGALRCLARTAICALVWRKGCFAALRFLCLFGARFALLSCVVLRGGEGLLFSVRTSPARGSRRRRFRS